MATKTMHTPGPWRTVIAWRHDKAEAVVGASHRSVCYLHWADREAEEVNANAHLIAAAPELLDALRRARPYVEASTPDSGCDHRPDSPCDSLCVAEAAGADLLYEIDRAIARATGEGA